MHQGEDNRKSESISCNLTPKKTHRTPRDGGSSKRDAMSNSQELKRRIHYTPHNSPDKYSKTPQSSGSFKKELMKSRAESGKRKIQSFHNDSPEKIQKTGKSGKFVNALIGQWSKHMGMQTPLSQTGKVQESPGTEEAKERCAVEERTIQKLQKKLEAAEETMSSLSASHEAELRAKEEILQQLNGDWESITKYYYEISESLKEFQQHKENLSKLYNDVIMAQQSTMKRVQQELSTMRLRDEDHKSVVTAMENKAANQEKRIQEMKIAETKLTKQLEDLKNKSILERDHLHNIHAEEKLELLKKQEKLTSANQDLEAQLKLVAEEKRNLTNSFAEKDEEFANLQKEIVTYKNKIEDLLCRNAELSSKYEKSIREEEELRKQLESKMEEITRLRDNLDARQEIESSLTKDLNMFDRKYKNMQDDLTNLKSQLKESQTCKSDLEKSLEDTKLSNKQKIMELNKTITILENEKDRILLEKHTKVQELEKACNLLKEKHEKEMISLKDEFETKIFEMKKTIDSQNSAFVRLNDTLHKMYEEKKDQEKEQMKEKYYQTKENRDKLQSGLKEKQQSTVELNTRQTKMGQTRELEEQFEDNVSSLKVSSRNKTEVPARKQQDIYNFNNTEVNRKLQNLQISLMKQDIFNLGSPIKFPNSTQNYSYFRDKALTQSYLKSPEIKEKVNEEPISATQKKKIFKTRNAGLKQYGTSRRIFKK